jgi:hypothetical protein
LLLLLLLLVLVLLQSCRVLSGRQTVFDFI